MRTEAKKKRIRVNFLQATARKNEILKTSDDDTGYVGVFGPLFEGGLGDNPQRNGVDLRRRRSSHEIRFKFVKTWEHCTRDVRAHPWCGVWHPSSVLVPAAGPYSSWMSAELGSGDPHRDSALTQPCVAWPPATKPYIGSAPDLPIETQYVDPKRPQPISWIKHSSGQLCVCRRPE